MDSAQVLFRLAMTITALMLSATTLAHAQSSVIDHANLAQNQDSAGTLRRL